MARGKRNGGRGDGDRANRGAHGGRGGGRYNHNRHTRGRGSGGGRGSVNNAPSAAFLAALEAQRAKQEAEEAEQQRRTRAVDGDSSASTAAEGEPSTRETPHVTVQRLKRPALPGFVFDEERGRYFKLTKQDEQAQLKKRRAEAIAQERADERRVRLESRAAVVGRVVARRAGWLGRLAQREISPTPALGDRSGLLPRYFTSRLSNHELRCVDVALDAVRDRFSAMDINADASSIYVGYASGVIRSFTVDNNPRERQHRQVVEERSVKIHSTMISAIRYHRRLSGVALFSAIGAGVSEPLTTLLSRGSHEGVSGRVFLANDATFAQSPVRAMPLLSWILPDPWTAEWSPLEDSTFSVGLHGDVGAAIIDGNFVGAPDRGVRSAPRGKIRSDTLSQAFLPHSSCAVVNGTRDGSWWLWDTRSPRRATEVVVNKKPKNIGAVQCLRVLNDERRLVQQRSNGELSVVDLRSPNHSIVTKFSSGVRDVYRSMLRFDVDEYETVVVAAMGSSIEAYDLHSGNELARMTMSERAEHNAADTEQVFLRDANTGPAVWSLSRSALYRSSSL